ncbi:MAG: squalene/phytoene synthase family protein [Deltaproteobacteria bacterium]|nr:squalene/phytoene synthase family protein [Deltaproteobacteria bacterium]
MDSQHYCHQVCKQSGSNFILAFYLLGKKKRLAMEVFYAFCRIVDDSVDEAPTPDKAKEALDFWRKEVHLLYEGNPQHLVSQALAGVVREYKIPKMYLQEIVAGCEMDLTKKTYETFSELQDYCFRVASCVGFVSIHIFGVTMTTEVKHGAIAMGKALQLTNILRDVASDLKRGRVYLPQEDLKKFRVTIEMLRESTNISEQREREGALPAPIIDIVDLLYFEIERARANFKEAWELFPKIVRERKKMLAAILMGLFYEAILNKITHDPLSVFRGKIRLTTVEKLKITSKELLKAFLS